MKDDTHKEADAIRSEIDNTRRRMDDTMDALGNRLHGRHLVDEILGVFRHGSNEGDGDGAADKLKRSAQAAARSVVDSVKENPMPALLIGAGVAWMIYQSTRSPEPDFDEEVEYEAGYSGDIGGASYDPELHIDRPLDYPTSGDGENGQDESFGEKVGDKLSAAKDAVADKASEVADKAAAAANRIKDKAGEKMAAVRDRTVELGAKAKEKTRVAYERSKEKIADTADRRPLELGLGCLAFGLVVGLLLPTPEKVDRVAGPKIKRLRRKTREAGREVIDKGRRVAQAAASAVKDEANAQGLTLDAIKEKVGAAAERGREAATDQAQQEGMTPSTMLGGGDNGSATTPTTP